MKCKDIPDFQVLEFLALYDPEWCNWNMGNQRDICNAFPDGTPKKMVLSKIKSLIRRGLVDGCGCGCRGDFALTEKGKSLLTQKTLPCG